ncbi:MAG: hypothetical protein GF383_16505 [Candidatus Lokiarchaeota archaeon]|nr:hypothetical protein [Candidatus Lokiarchaeota archaeon]
MLIDVLRRYEEGVVPLESILTSRFHTYHDEFQKMMKIILYILRKVSSLSELDIYGLDNQAIVLKCLQSWSFFRTMKNANWGGFNKTAEDEGEMVYHGIFNNIKTITLTDLAPQDKKIVFVEYVNYIKSRGRYKSRFLNRISNYSVGRLWDLLKLYERKIDELWDKYKREKRDTINKIIKEVMYYYLYYRVLTITIGYNKGWQSQRFRKIKLKKLTRD